jgi:hypothetical protein
MGGRGEIRSRVAILAHAAGLVQCRSELRWHDALPARPQAWSRQFRRTDSWPNYHRNAVLEHAQRHQYPKHPSQNRTHLVVAPAEESQIYFLAVCTLGCHCGFRYSGSGGIAQLVERLVRNEKARGSNPLTSTTPKLCILEVLRKLKVFATVFAYHPSY